MMTKLHNTGGGVRVVYTLEGKARSLPPNAEVDLMLDERMYNRLKKASDAGDTLRVITLDYQPLEEADPPAAPSNGAHADPVERQSFTDPAPTEPPEERPAGTSRRKKPAAKKTERVRRSGAVTTKGL